MKPSELKRIVNKEFNIDTLRAYQGVIEDRIYFVEKAIDLGTRPQIKGFMSHMKNLKEALRQLQEEQPGLWANIRAKRARGEKPSHGNSNAHKDAVKAGKKINKMSEGEGKSIQDLKMGEKFTFNGKEFTFIELYPDIENAARVILPDGRKSVVSFGGKVNTGKKADIGPDYFGQGKGHHIDENADSDIETIIKLVKSANNPKNLPISFGSTSVAVGGTQYDKGELVSIFNGKELGMDSMDIRKVFYNANKNAKAIADKINASNSGVVADIGHGYGKEPILYLKRKAKDHHIDEAEQAFKVISKEKTTGFGGKSYDKYTVDMGQEEYTTPEGLTFTLRVEGSALVKPGEKLDLSRGSKHNLYFASIGIDYKGKNLETIPGWATDYKYVKAQFTKAKKWLDKNGSKLIKGKGYQHKST